MAKQVDKSKPYAVIERYQGLWRWRVYQSCKHGVCDRGSNFTRCGATHAAKRALRNLDSKPIEIQ